VEHGLAEAVERAQGDLDGTREAGPGELIEGADSFTFVLVAPGYSRRDIGVRAEDDRLKVEAYDFKIVRAFGCAVAPGTARSTYLDGVLSVRVDKKV
jgi:HSP20 family molecular chaperone IbpA